MGVNLTTLSPGEEAVAKTLRGWGAELDNEQKFWWADWMGMIRDVVTAMRTGEPCCTTTTTDQRRQDFS